MGSLRLRPLIELRKVVESKRKASPVTSPRTNQHRMKTPQFYLKEPGADRATPIIACLYFSGKRLKVYSGQSIHPNQWNATKQRAKRGIRYESLINKRLDAIALAMATAYLDARGSGKVITIELVRSRFLAIDSAKLEAAPPDFLALFDQFIEASRGRVKERTRTIYRMTKNHLSRFATAYGIRLSLERMDVLFYDKWVGYLLNVAGVNNNTAWNLVKNLKVFLRWARDNDHAVNEAFESFSVRKHEPPPITLTAGELSALEQCDLSNEPRIAHARDLFVLLCYTGLRYSDLAQLRPEHRTGDTLRITTQKTSEPLTIPLLPPAKAILARYPALQLHVISNQRLNEYLKEAAQRAGLTTSRTVVDFKGTTRVETTKPLHELIGTHCGRRTFVTLSLERGMRPETVMRITGHKDRRSFQRYVEITNTVAARELEEAWTQIRRPRRKQSHE